MELKLDEQTLLANFNRLNSEGKKELLDYAAFLHKKQSNSLDAEPEPDNQCKVSTPSKAKSAWTKDPLITE